MPFFYNKNNFCFAALLHESVCDGLAYQKNDYTNEGKNRILKGRLRFRKETENNINQGADK